MRNAIEMWENQITTRQNAKTVKIDFINRITKMVKVEFVNWFKFKSPKKK